MDGKNRKDIEIGGNVAIVLKKDQRSGELTEGNVKDILTQFGIPSPWYKSEA